MLFTAGLRFFVKTSTLLLQSCYFAFRLYYSAFGTVCTFLNSVSSFFYTMFNLKISLTFLILFSAFACKKNQTSPPSEAPVLKEVEYRVFAARDYSAPIYQDVSTDLRLQVRIINYRTGEMRLVWDSVFSNRKINDFPQSADAIVIKKMFPVMDSYEKLNGSYSVRYNNNGNISQHAGSDEAGPGRTAVRIEANL
jgi:hypothetical protein